MQPVEMPGTPRLMQTLEATWPPVEIVREGGWALNRGDGGGQRVSAATGSGDIATAEERMRAWGQTPLFRLGADDAALDADLVARGYLRHDPTVVYAASAEDIAGSQTHVAAAYVCQFRPAIMEEIWHAAGIGPGRLAVMDRAPGPKSFLMSRADDTPAGVAFVAVDGDAAMVHAIEVLPRLRRQGAALLLMEAAARFARLHGARWLTLAVTEANAPARTLYARLGMLEVGNYHYRRHPETT